MITLLILFPYFFNVCRIDNYVSSFITGIVYFLTSLLFLDHCPRNLTVLLIFSRNCYFVSLIFPYFRFLGFPFFHLLFSSSTYFWFILSLFFLLFTMKGKIIIVEGKPTDFRPFFISNMNFEAIYLPLNAALAACHKF